MKCWRKEVATEYEYDWDNIDWGWDRSSENTKRNDNQPSIQVILNWDEEPTNLDLVIEESSTTYKCITSELASGSKCAKVETIPSVQIHQETAIISHNLTTHYVYRIIVDTDWDKMEFKTSGARIAITDGRQQTERRLNGANYNDEQFWLVGCLRGIVGPFPTYEFIEPGKEEDEVFFNEDTEDEDYCLKLFGYEV